MEMTNTALLSTVSNGAFMESPQFTRINEKAQVDLHVNIMLPVLFLIRQHLDP